MVPENLVSRGPEFKPHHVQFKYDCLLAQLFAKLTEKTITIFIGFTFFTSMKHMIIQILLSHVYAEGLFSWPKDHVRGSVGFQFCLIYIVSPYSISLSFQVKWLSNKVHRQSFQVKWFLTKCTILTEIPISIHPFSFLISNHQSSMHASTLTLNCNVRGSFGLQTYQSNLNDRPSKQLMQSIGLNLKCQMFFHLIDHCNEDQ